MRAKVYGRFGSNRLEGEGRLYTQEQMNADPTYYGGDHRKNESRHRGLTAWPPATRLRSSACGYWSSKLEPRLRRNTERAADWFAHNYE
jgi:hypothetical protein